ncbi:hypothetical protein P154DRAFT_38980 [Amniculicola lignicola CBS 123094]|uniref:Extracellular membrane protein CFEM domain-containing protein n=1 Tax=Amniculicola lignicola CBS 123094 TaxID=1392246 RepID=A0A6A5W1Y7_9PLEO|nr:hypothetical protein P154DRAFT_38980 [Amniculicola lignicola CBS 123094]
MKITLIFAALLSVTFALPTNISPPPDTHQGSRSGHIVIKACAVPCQNDADHLALGRCHNECSGRNGAICFQQSQLGLCEKKYCPEKFKLKGEKEPVKKPTPLPLHESLRAWKKIFFNLPSLLKPSSAALT